MSGPLAAVLFDLDGLLIDSEPQWFAAETATVTSMGGTWTKANQLDLLGHNLDYAARYMIEVTGSDHSHAQVMELLEDNMTAQLHQAVTFRQGALELLDELQAGEVRIGIVTSSTRRHLDMVREHLASYDFDVTVTADDVDRLKPDPLPYLAALERLSVPGDSVVVLEDSPPGVAAAEAAGCWVVAVPSVTEIPPAATRTVVRSLADMNLGLLRRMV